MVQALSDPSPDVRIVAAQTLGQFGTDADLALALPILIALADPSANDVFTALSALAALDALGPKAAPALPSLKGFKPGGPVPDPRYASYVPRLLEDLLAGGR